MSPISDKKKKKTNPAIYVVGSLAIAATAIVVMPKVINFVSEQIADINTPKVADGDDWGPEIVKKESATKKGEEDSEDGKL